MEIIIVAIEDVIFLKDWAVKLLVFEENVVLFFGLAFILITFLKFNYFVSIRFSGFRLEMGMIMNGGVTMKFEFSVRIVFHIESWIHHCDFEK